MCTLGLGDSTAISHLGSSRAGLIRYSLLSLQTATKKNLYHTYQYLRNDKAKFRVKSKKEDISINEEILAKLIATEKEAERLKKELDSLKGQAAEAKSMEGGVKSSRGPVFDEDKQKRETIIPSGVREVDWLSEADVDFLIGESNGEQGQIVRRRLLIGTAIAALIGGASLIPDQYFQFFKPPNSLKFYLVPILRSMDLLEESSGYVENAEWNSVRAAIDRIKNKPNSLQQNLTSAAMLLTDAPKRTSAQAIILQIMEYLNDVDFNKYFEDRLVQVNAKGGARQQEFVDFSGRALKTAKKSLIRFLKLFPSEVVKEAQDEIKSAYL